MAGVKMVYNTPLTPRIILCSSHVLFVGVLTEKFEIDSEVCGVTLIHINSVWTTSIENPLYTRSLIIHLICSQIQDMARNHEGAITT